MTVWDIMDGLLADCESYLNGIVSGRIQNGDPAALHEFQQRVAPKLGPVSLAALIRAWQEKYQRPASLPSKGGKEE